MLRKQEKRRTEEGLPLLPDPACLQEYEYASEGAADRIITMARLEQEHRQRLEEDALSFYRFSYRFGQTCGFMLLFIVVIVCVYLTMNDNETFATFLTLTVFSAVAFANVTAFFTVRKLLGDDVPDGYNRARARKNAAVYEKDKKKNGKQRRKSSPRRKKPSA